MMTSHALLLLCSTSPFSFSKRWICSCRWTFLPRLFSIAFLKQQEQQNAEFVPLEPYTPPISEYRGGIRMSVGLNVALFKRPFSPWMMASHFPCGAFHQSLPQDSVSCSHSSNMSAWPGMTRESNTKTTLRSFIVCLVHFMTYR